MGGRKPTVSDEEFLRQFATATPPVLGTTDLKEEFGFSSQGAKSRLDDLEDRGLLNSHDLGNARAWWITDAGREYLREQGETDG